MTENGCLCRVVRSIQDFMNKIDLYFDLENVSSFIEETFVKTFFFI